MSNITKAKLEQQKLLLEISELKKPWYRKPSYIGIFVPSILAFFSILTIFFSGLFDAKRELLKLERSKLEKDIDNFEKRKNALLKQIDTLNNVILGYSKKVKYLEKENIELKEELSKIHSPNFRKVDSNDISLSRNDGNFILALKLTMTTPVGVYKPNDDFLDRVTDVIESYIRRYKDGDNNVKILITGNSDNAPIWTSGLRYAGEFGDMNEKYFFVNANIPETIVLKTGGRIDSNKELAFLRALNVKQALIKSDMIKTDDIDLQVQINPQIGQEYRSTEIRVSIRAF